MPGWFRPPAAWASFSKRRRRSGSCEKDSGRTLIATSRFRRSSRARYTSPIPPAPMCETVSYGPNRVPAAIIPAASFRRAPAPRLQVVEPVQGEVESLRGGLRRVILDQEEALAVPGDVPAAFVVPLEERLRPRGGECRRRRDGDPENLLVLPVEDLAAIRRPHGSISSIGRDLPLAARTRELGDIDLHLPGFVGLVHEPAPVGRERSSHVAE